MNVVMRCTHCKERFFVHRPRVPPCPICRARLDAAAPSGSNEQRALPGGLVPIPAASPGSYERGAGTYRSIKAFIGARRERVYSRERDFGLRWRDGQTLYRAAWIAETGEVYLVQLGAPAVGGGHVELLAAGIESEELAVALSGWSEAQDAGEHSLDWLRERVSQLASEAAAA